MCSDYTSKWVPSTSGPVCDHCVDNMFDYKTMRKKFKKKEIKV